MNDEPRRVIIGGFSGAISHLTLSPEVLKAAETELDKAAAEKAAIRPQLIVDARVFNDIVAELRTYLEEARYTAIRLGDRYTAARLARRLGHLRQAYQSAKPYKRPQP
jgi:hypothetical protein